MEEKTVRFNEIQGKKIADLMKKSSMPKMNINSLVGSESEESEINKKKLGPVSPIKTIQFQKIEPTSIKSSNIN